MVIFTIDVKLVRNALQIVVWSAAFQQVFPLVRNVLHLIPLNEILIDGLKHLGNVCLMLLRGINCLELKVVIVPYERITRCQTVGEHFTDCCHILNKYLYLQCIKNLTTTTT